MGVKKITEVDSISSVDDGASFLVTEEISDVESLRRASMEAIVKGLENNGIAANNAYYETLDVGRADNLVDRKGNGTSQNFIYRTSAGTDSIEDDGTGIIQSIHGNTIVWNQLAKNGNFESENGWTINSGSKSLENNVLTITASANSANVYRSDVNIEKGHIYYASFDFKSSILAKCGVQVRGIGATTNMLDYQTTSVDAWNSIDGIVTAENSSATSNRLFIYCDRSSIGISGDKYYLRNIMLIDLTLMFGSGNEPSTAAAFKALFPLDYYAYDAGSLLNLTATGIKTVGFNAFNSSTNTAELLGGQQYQIVGTYTSITYSTGETITPSTVSGVTKCFTPTSNGTLTVVGASTGFCVHLTHSGYRNGETEDYWTRTLALPISTYFASGMRSAGSAYDELTPTKAITRIGVVDLGTLNWSYANECFITTGSQIAGSVGSVNSSNNVVCTKYNAKPARGYSSGYSDKQCGLSAAGTQIIIKDTSYTDATTFKTAMSGVYLYYELATPTEVAISPALNLTYTVADYGTEQILPENDDEPTTSPLTAVIKYNDDYTRQVVNAKKNYQSQDSMAALLTALGTALNGTLTTAWDSTNEKWTYTLAIPDASKISGLPQNYQSQTSMGELLTALGTALNGTITSAWDSTNNKYVYTFTIPDGSKIANLPQNYISKASMDELISAVSGFCTVTQTWDSTNNKYTYTAICYHYVTLEAGEGTLIYDGSSYRKRFDIKVADGTLIENTSVGATGASGSVLANSITINNTSYTIVDSSTFATLTNGNCRWGLTEDYDDRDLNGDGAVSANDAVYILWNTFYPDEYPLRAIWYYDFSGTGSRMNITTGNYLQHNINESSTSHTVKYKIDGDMVIYSQRVYGVNVSNSGEVTLARNGSSIPITNVVSTRVLSLSNGQNMGLVFTTSYNLATDIYYSVSKGSTVIAQNLGYGTVIAPPAGSGITISGATLTIDTPIDSDYTIQVKGSPWIEDEYVLPYFEDDDDDDAVEVADM